MIKPLLLISLLAAGTAVAGFDNWINKDGKTAELELFKVTEEAGEKVGHFRMRSGRSLTLKASQLSDASATRLAEWKGEGGDAAGAASGPASKFDDVLDGNLVKFDGKSVKDCELEAKPEKYYVFYYSASWCGPCQAYTPSLVEFYEDNKNDNWELVFISSDRDDDSMEGYMEQKHMPWPALDHSKVKKFRGKFDHGVSGIPSVIVCEIDGKNLGNFRSKLDELKKMVK